jgi:hypothetical protein
MSSDIEGFMPPKDLPVVNCDFNACGLSGEPSDDCYYRLDPVALVKLSDGSANQIFIYTDDTATDGAPEIFGCVAFLERYSWPHTSGWRARPIKGTWYRGPAHWL